MTSKTYRITLRGRSVTPGRVSSAALRDLLTVVIEGTRGALRLRLEGKSKARGTQPKWLDAAASFDIAAIERGSSVLVVEAPLLKDAMPSSRQMGFFPDVDPECTGVDVFAQSLNDVLESRYDSERYDAALVKEFEQFSRVLARGVDEFDVVGDGTTLSFTRSSLGSIRAVREKIPAPRWVRVAGRLDEIRHSDQMFTLILGDGSRLRGVADPDEVGAETLRALFGHDVVVSGHVQFRPSREILRVEASSLDEAVGDVSMWQEKPLPILEGLEERAAARSLEAQGPRSGINAVIGKWPGDESDSELVRALRDLS